MGKGQPSPDVSGYWRSGEDISPPRDSAGRQGACISFQGRKYETKGCSPRQWECSLEILQRGNPCEAELCARRSRFHLIVGNHSYGNYFCIPDWDVGTKLSTLTELFWNEERLWHYSRMKKADACTIVSALKVMAEH